MAAIEAGDVSQAQGALKEAMRLIDKAAKHNIIHANTAARKKSHLSRRVLALEKGA